MNWKRLVPPVAVLVLWQAGSTAGLIPGFKLPSPLQVMGGLTDLVLQGMPPGHRLHVHVLYSLERVLWGYGLAVLVAVPLGVLMGWSRRVRDGVEPLVEILRPIPPLAWIPIAILWFGIGIRSAAFIIFLGAFFPVLLNTVSGVRSIDPLLIEAARMLNAGRRFIFLKVLLPGAVPSILTGMRIGIGIGWMSVVAAEFTGVRQGYGLGYMIMTARDIQRPDEILAGMLVIGLIGLGIDGCLRLAERRLVRWR
jgi:ABC-type nitrate/sulfonate/bicarbonate transport system permease component